MAIIEQPAYAPLVDESDPDDYRPNSSLALVIDPSSESGSHVQSMTVLFERLAVGDKIPLHVHSIDELVIIDDGAGEVTLGEERRVVHSGSIVFVPAGTPHGTRNLGRDILRLHAVFPSEVIPIQYLERNPAPGTEANAPQPLVVFNVRERLEGNRVEDMKPQ